MSNFSNAMYNVNESFSSAKSYCLDTVVIQNSEKGKLNGCREFSYSWCGVVPFRDDVPLGEYTVKCIGF